MPSHAIHNAHHARHLPRAIRAAAQEQQQADLAARNNAAANQPGRPGDMRAAETARTSAIPSDATAAAGSTGSGQDEGFSFWDLLDVVNPLQHIPVVNRVYRAVTGDTIKPAAQIAGSTLMFGVAGLAVASAEALLKHETGRDAGEHVMAMVFGGEGGGEEGPQSPVPGAAATQLAAAPSPNAPSAASMPAAAARTADAVSLDALRQEQLKRMTETPGGSAAAMAAAGLAGAASATLPAPGTGGGDAVMAALMNDTGGGSGKKEPAVGLGLAQYRQMARSDGPATTRPLVPSKAVQMVNAERTRAAQEALLRAQEEAARPVPPPEPQVADLPAPRDPAPAGAAPTDATRRPTASAEPPAGPAAADTSQTTSWTQGGTPALPSALISDLMMANLAKYEALAKDRQRR